MRSNNQTIQNYFSRQLSQPVLSKTVQAFIAAIVPFLNNWHIDLQQEELVNTLEQFRVLQPLSEYRQCINALKRFVNSREFPTQGRYEQTDYLWGGIQYIHETKAFKQWNEKIDHYLKSLSQTESKENTVAWVAQMLASGVAEAVNAAGKLTQFVGKHVKKHPVFSVVSIGAWFEVAGVGANSTASGSRHQHLGMENHIPNKYSMQLFNAIQNQTVVEAMGNEILFTQAQENKEFQSPEVATLNNKNTMVVYASRNANNTDSDIYGFTYNATSKTTSNHFLINTPTTCYQSEQRIASMPNGGAAIVWTTYNQVHGIGDIHLAIVNGQGVHIGNVITVNSHTAGIQARPDVTVLANGDIIVVWHSYGQDSATDYGVFYRRFSSSGVPLTGDIQVNTNTVGNQWHPSVAALPDGGFVIQYVGYVGGNSIEDLFIQRYTSAGARSGSIFRVNSYAPSNQGWARVYALSNGGYASVYETNYGGVRLYDIAARFFDVNNQPSTEVILNQFTSHLQVQPRAAVFDNNRFVITWTSQSQDGSGWGSYTVVTDLMGQILSAGEIQMNSYTPNNQYGAVIASLPNDMFMAFWQSQQTNAVLYSIIGRPFRLATQSYNNTELARQQKALINTYTAGNQELPAVAALNQDRFVTVWQSLDEDNSSWGIYGQFTTTNGVRSGNPFRINQYTANAQQAPRVARISDTRFAVTWMSYQQYGNDWRVYTRVFDANGNPITDELLVSSQANSRQLNPDIARTGDGGFAVVYESDGQINGSDIFIHFYTADGMPIDSESLVNTYTTGHQQRPTITTLTDGTLLVGWQSSNQENGIDGYVQRVNTDGSYIGIETRVNIHIVNDQAWLRVMAMPNNAFVATWMSDLQDGNGWGIVARYFADNYLSSSPEILVNTVTASDQQYPVAVNLEDNSFEIIWQSLESGRWLLKGARFALDGSVIDREFLISTATQGSLTHPAVAHRNNRQIIVYQTNQPVTEQWDIYGANYVFGRRPVLQKNQFVILEGQTIVVDESMLMAINFNYDDASLLFIISDAQHCYFTNKGLPATEFKQSDIANGNIRLTHSGGEDQPVFKVSVTDGELSSEPSWSNINFTNVNDAPVLVTNQFALIEDKPTIITTVMLAATDVDNDDAALQFIVSDVQHGQFEYVNNPNVAISQFSQQAVINSQVRFVPDGGENAPSFNVSVSDGQMSTTPVPASVQYTRVNDAPVLVTNQFALIEDKPTIITTVMLAATDVDNDDATLQFIVSDVQHGQFEYVNNPSVAISQFSQQAVINGQVRFVPDGGENAPSFNVSVSDGQFSTTPTPAVIQFTLVDDTPVLTRNALTVHEANPQQPYVSITRANLLATDEDTNDANLIFHISNIQHGRFVHVNQLNQAITEFSLQDIDLSYIRFYHDGGEVAPSYLVSVSDGNSESAAQPVSVNFIPYNDASVVQMPLPGHVQVPVGSVFSYVIPPGTFWDPENKTLTLSAHQANGSALPKTDDVELAFRSVNNGATLSGIVRNELSIELEIMATDPENRSTAANVTFIAIQDIPSKDDSEDNGIRQALLEIFTPTISALFSILGFWARSRYVKKKWERRAPTDLYLHNQLRLLLQLDLGTPDSKEGDKFVEGVNDINKKLKLLHGTDMLAAGVSDAQKLRYAESLQRILLDEKKNNGFTKVRVRTKLFFDLLPNPTNYCCARFRQYTLKDHDFLKDNSAAIANQL